jgi:hypothetical protein
MDRHLRINITDFTAFPLIYHVPTQTYMQHNLSTSRQVKLTGVAVSAEICPPVDSFTLFVTWHIKFSAHTAYEHVAMQLILKL